MTAMGEHLEPRGGAIFSDLKQGRFFNGFFLQVAAVNLVNAPDISHETPSLDHLSDRQRQILDLQGRGLTQSEIGRQIGFSRAVITKDLSSVYNYLGVSGQAQAENAQRVFYRDKVKKGEIGRKKSKPAKADRLVESDLQTLFLSAQGLVNQEIAELMSCTESAVISRSLKIGRKLRTKSKAGSVVKALETGIISGLTINECRLVLAAAPFMPKIEGYEEVDKRFWREQRPDLEVPYRKGIVLDWIAQTIKQFPTTGFSVDDLTKLVFAEKYDQRGMYGLRGEIATFLTRQKGPGYLNDRLKKDKMKYQALETPAAKDGYGLLFVGTPFDADTPSMQDIKKLKRLNDDQLREWAIELRQTELARQATGLVMSERTIERTRNSIPGLVSELLKQNISSQFSRKEIVDKIAQTTGKDPKKLAHTVEVAFNSGSVEQRLIAEGLELVKVVGHPDNHWQRMAMFMAVEPAEIPQWHNFVPTYEGPSHKVRPSKTRSWTERQEARIATVIAHNERRADFEKTEKALSKKVLGAVEELAERGYIVNGNVVQTLAKRNWDAALVVLKGLRDDGIIDEAAFRDRFATSADLVIRALCQVDPLTKELFYDPKTSGMTRRLVEKTVDAKLKELRS